MTIKRSAHISVCCIGGKFIDLCYMPCSRTPASQKDNNKKLDLLFECSSLMNFMADPFTCHSHDIYIICITESTKLMIIIR